MYAGHIGVALGAKGIRRTIPLWILVLASQLPDWSDATLCIAGVRPSVPGMLSHSLPAVAILAAVIALAFYARERDTAGAMIVLAVVLSHAAGDYLTGIKPTWPGGPMIGLELYRRPMADVALESVVIVAGWLLYRRSFPEDRRGTRAMTAIPVALMAVQLAADIVFMLKPGLTKC